MYNPSTHFPDACTYLNDRLTWYPLNCNSQVQVHIIEARELKAENLDGTSDPVVYVECFDQKQNTICIKQVTFSVV